MDKNEFVIREIEPQDNEGIYKLIQGILESFELDKPGTAYYDPYLSKLYEYYNELPNGEYWIIAKENKVYGGIGIGPFNSHKDVAEVQKFYISKDLQGLGYGRKLYELVESYAVDKGYKKLYIETTDALGNANNIYKHFGFENRGHPLNGSEHKLMNIWLEKEL